jgi:hypothetical protein
MKFREVKCVKKRICIVVALTLLLTMFAASIPAFADSSWCDGVNWADARDNYVNGWVIPSGLTSSDSNSSANATAKAIVGQFQSVMGANTVRMPINEPTVSGWWSVYTGAIDGALSKGVTVILAYWPWHNGKPDDTNKFYTMWDTVVNKYKGNSKVVFEIMNEPYAYSTNDWLNLCSAWLQRYSSVPRNRVLVGGTGYCDRVANVGTDSRVSGCSFSQHIYAFWDTSKTTEAAWKTDLKNRIGSNYANTIVTEYGAPMTTGKNYNGAINGNNEVAFMYGVPNQLRDWGTTGSCYWPGLRDGDSYSITKRNGSGSGTTLSVTNSSGRVQIRWGWGF